jgi:hypothetical protein
MRQNEDYAKWLANIYAIVIIQTSREGKNYDVSLAGTTVPLLDLACIIGNDDQCQEHRIEFHITYQPIELIVDDTYRFSLWIANSRCRHLLAGDAPVGYPQL